MYYKDDEYKLYEQGKQFIQALTRKLGHATKDPAEVKQALKAEIQEMLDKNGLVIFEGLYGWAYALASGRSGTASMLVQDMLAIGGEDEIKT